MGYLFTAANQDGLLFPAPVVRPPLTMSCWYRINSLPDAPVPAALCDADSRNDYTFFVPHSIVLKDVWWSAVEDGGGPFAALTSFFAVDAGATWYHVLGVYEDVEAGKIRSRLYFQGAEAPGSPVETTEVLPDPLVIDTLSVGFRKSDDVGHCDGTIHGVAVWQGAYGLDLAEFLAGGGWPGDWDAGRLRFHLGADFRDIISGATATIQGNPVAGDSPPNAATGPAATSLATLMPVHARTLFDVRHFGEYVVYTPAGGGARTIPALIDDAVDLDSGQLVRSRRVIAVLADEAVNEATGDPWGVLRPGAGDTAVIRGRLHRLEEFPPSPDGSPDGVHDLVMEVGAEV